MISARNYKLRIKNVLYDYINFNEHYEELSDICRMWLVNFLTHILSSTQYEDWPDPDENDDPIEWVAIFLGNMYDDKKDEAIDSISRNECHAQTFFHHDYSQVYEIIGIILRYYTPIQSTDPRDIIELVVEEYLIDNNDENRDSQCHRWMTRVLTDILLTFNNQNIDYRDELRLSIINRGKLYKKIKMQHINTDRCQLEDFIHNYYRELRTIVSVVLNYSRFHRNFGLNR
jgi:hypothetical protein